MSIKTLQLVGKVELGLVGLRQPAQTLDVLSGFMRLTMPVGVKYDQIERLGEFFNTLGRFRDSVRGDA
jgi:hypothetical protein